VLWDCQTGKRLALPALIHSSTITKVQFSRDGRFLVTGTSDGTVFVWKANDGGLVWKRRISTDTVREIEVGNHRRELAVKTSQKYANSRISVLDLETGILVAEPIELLSRIESFNWLGEADELATSSRDGTVRVWRLHGDETAIALPHSLELSCVALTDDRRLLATVDEAGNCCLVQPHSIQAIQSHEMTTFPTLITQATMAALTDDGTTLAIADQRSNVSVFDLATKHRIARIEVNPPVLRIAFTPDGHHLITVSRDGHITAWKAATGERTQHQQLKANRDFTLGTIQGTLCVAVAGEQLFVRDALNPTWAGVSLNHNSVVEACCISRDRRFLLSACADGIVHIWECSSGKVVSATPKLPQFLCSAAFSPDGTYFVTGARDGTVRLWHTADALPATGTFSHGSIVTSLLYSPDGRFLVTSSDNLLSMGRGETVFRVWDAATADPICSREVTRLCGRFPIPNRSNHPWRLAATFFSPGTQDLNFVTAGGVMATLELRADSRPSQAFLREVAIRSGTQVDSAGGLLLIDAEQIRSMSQAPDTHH
jgi:WD40 repeat protein